MSTSIKAHDLRKEKPTLCSRKHTFIRWAYSSIPQAQIYIEKRIVTLQYENMQNYDRGKWEEKEERGWLYIHGKFLLILSKC